MSGRQPTPFAEFLVRRSAGFIDAHALTFEDCEAMVAEKRLPGFTEALRLAADLWLDQYPLDSMPSMMHNAFLWLANGAMSTALRERLAGESEPT